VFASSDGSSRSLQGAMVRFLAPLWSRRVQVSVWLRTSTNAPISLLPAPSTSNPQALLRMEVFRPRSRRRGMRAHGTAQVRTRRRPRSQRRLRRRGCSRRSEPATRRSRRLRRARRFHRGAGDRPNVPRLPTRPAPSGDRASHVLQPNERPSCVSGLRREHVALLLCELAQQEPDVPRWTESVRRGLASRPRLDDGVRGWPRASVGQVPEPPQLLRAAS
jgi:hypothetical protein